MSTEWGVLWRHSDGREEVVGDYTKRGAAKAVSECSGAGYGPRAVAVVSREVGPWVRSGQETT